MMGNCQCLYFSRGLAGRIDAHDMDKVKVVMMVINCMLRVVTMMFVMLSFVIISSSEHRRLSQALHLASDA